MKELPNATRSTLSGFVDRQCRKCTAVDWTTASERNAPVEMETAIQAIL